MPSNMTVTMIAFFVLQQAFPKQKRNGSCSFMNGVLNILWTGSCSMITMSNRALVIIIIIWVVDSVWKRKYRIKQY